MKQSALVLFLVMWVHLTVSGQGGLIQGKVFDSSSQTAVEGADVLLLHPKSNKPLFQTRTGSRGFVFRQVPEGSYGLVVVALGFVNDTMRLAVKNGDSLHVPVALRPAQNELGDVVVKAAPRPVTLKGDTLSFNAAAYALRPDAQLEDLLRMLPGVDVDKEGNVTFQGRKVDKVMINGEEFFIGGPKGANSLPAEIIASVEAFSTQSAAAKFSGIKDNSETHTLNIKTKKGMDEAWIGNIYGSKGQKRNYATGGAVTKLGKQLMLRTNLANNNINNRFVGVESKSTSPQAGVQSATTWEFTLMKKWGSKLNLNVSSIGSNQKTEVLETTSQRTFFSDSSLQENRQGHRSSIEGKYPLNLKMTYNPDERNQWEFASVLSVSQKYNNGSDTAGIQTLQNNERSYRSSHVQINNRSDQHGLSLRNQVDWRHRFSKPGRTLQWSLSQATQSAGNAGSLFSMFNRFSPAGSLQQQVVTDQQYQQHNKGKEYGGSVTFTEPLSPLYSLLLGYNFSTQSQLNDKESNSYDSITGRYDHPDPLTSNRFKNSNATHRIEGLLVRNERKFNYKLGLDWQYSLLNSLNFAPYRHVDQRFINLLPKANVFWVLRGGHSLNVSYSGYGSLPAADQLQPLPDISNPLFIKAGNPDLKQSYIHNVFFRLQTAIRKNLSSFSVSVSGDVVRNQIVSSIKLLPGGVQQQQFVNVNGSYHMVAAATYGFVLGGKKGTKNNASVFSRITHGHDVTLLNEQLNNTNSFTWLESLRFSYSLGRKLITDATGGTSFSIYSYSLSPQHNTRSWNHNATLNISYELPLGIVMQAGYTWVHLGTSGLLPSQVSSLLNAVVYKRLFEGSKWQVRISGFDLLNTNRNYTQNAGLNYVSTQQTNQLQRMFLISLVYDFKVITGLKK